MFKRIVFLSRGCIKRESIDVSIYIYWRGGVKELPISFLLPR